MAWCDGPLVTELNGFTPAAADRFKVLTSGNPLTGTWIVDPGWTPANNPNDVTLSNP